MRSDGTPGNDFDAEVHAISDDGRDVMFRSGGLVPDDNGAENEYVRDRVAHQTYLVDRNQDEKIADDWSSYGSDISGDGNRVAMSSQATNLVPNDTNGTIDVFVQRSPVRRRHHRRARQRRSPAFRTCTSPLRARARSRMRSACASRTFRSRSCATT